MTLTGHEYWALFPGQNIYSGRLRAVLLDPQNSVFVSSFWIPGSLTSLGSLSIEGEKCLQTDSFFSVTNPLIRILLPQILEVQTLAITTPSLLQHAYLVRMSQVPVLYYSQLQETTTKRKFP